MKPRIKICMGSSCFRRGNRKNLEYIERYLEDNDCTADVELVGSRCEEQCRKGPNLQINGQMFHEVNLDVLVNLLELYVGKKPGA